MKKKESGREKERDEGLKETRVPECLFEFLAKWPSVRSAGHPSQPASQPASRSQTKSHGFTYYDLHPCPLPLLLFLLPSRLLPPHSPSPSPPPPLPSPPSCLVLARACLLSLLHPSPSSIPSFPSSFFDADLKKKCRPFVYSCLTLYAFVILIYLFLVLFSKIIYFISGFLAPIAL